MKAAPTKKPSTKCDSDLFTVTFNDDRTFSIKLNGTASITPRVTNFLDCGFSLYLPENTHLAVFAKPEFAEKGVILTCNVQGNDDYQRVKVYFHNVGKEIFAIGNGDLLGTACIENKVHLPWSV